MQFLFVCFRLCAVLHLLRANPVHGGEAGHTPQGQRLRRCRGRHDTPHRNASRAPTSRSLTELTRQITPPTKNGHATPPIESRKNYQSVNPYSAPCTPGPTPIRVRLRRCGVRPDCRGLELRGGAPEPDAGAPRPVPRSDPDGSIKRPANTRERLRGPKAFALLAR